ncbi:hypothetical protein ACTJJT_13740, partial [Pseudomonas sp. 22373]
RMMGADGFGYFGHDQSNPPEGRKGDYAPPSRMNTYLMWMLTSKKQEARSKKQEARSKKQEARSKKQEAKWSVLTRRTVICDGDADSRYARTQNF